MGTGGAPEGVITAAALRCLGGEIQARFRYRSDDERERGARMGHGDEDRVYMTEDLAPGENLVFAATGVTAGDLLQGVRFFGGGARTHTLTMAYQAKQVRFIDTVHMFDRDSPPRVRLSPEARRDTGPSQPGGTVMPLDSINLADWIEANRDSLKPPVGNKLVYGDGEFQVMIVAGPNSRRDYHCEPGEELFYQLKGDIMLKLIEDGVPRDVIIREGDMFLLPANTIHSPRRPAGTSAWSSSASAPRTRRSRSAGTARPAATCCTSSRA